MNAKYPDFKHKKTEEALWLCSNLCPKWVQAELVAAILPGTLESTPLFAWNTKLARYVKNGKSDDAMNLFRQMQQECVKPDRFTFIEVLKACGSLQALEDGRNIHTQITQSDCGSHIFVGNSLVDMYVKCGSLEAAWKVFNSMHTHGIIAWNAIILGHLACGQAQKVLALSRQMQREGVKPNCVTVMGILNACASIGALKEGQRVHEQIIQCGLQSNPNVSSSLVDMYSECGSLENAMTEFNRMPQHNVFAWNAVISGHVKCGQGMKALALYQEMQQRRVQPNLQTFVGVLNVCASLSACVSVDALDEGRRVHEQIIECSLESDVVVSSSLVDMYVKCGSMEDAWRVFNKMPTHDLVAWNAMILGHVKYGQGQKALALAQEMRQDGVEPDPVTFAGVLSACASLGALREGRCVHEQIIQCGLESDVDLGSRLVDMYAKCGSIEEAWRVFNIMPTDNLAKWNAILEAYAIHGHVNEALGLFERMCNEGVKIDKLTFLSVLSACGRAGLVDEALYYFGSMTSDHRISATEEHYTCMVDLLGCAGRLDEAEDLIKMMPCEPSASLWKALLGACKIHSNVEMGERIAKQVLEVDPKDATCYALLSEIHAATEKL